MKSWENEEIYLKCFRLDASKIDECMLNKDLELKWELVYYRIPEYTYFDRFFLLQNKDNKASFIIVGENWNDDILLQKIDVENDYAFKDFNEGAAISTYDSNSISIDNLTLPML